MKSGRLHLTVTASHWRSLLAVAWLCVGACATSSGQPATDRECLQLFDTYNQGVYVCQEHRDLLVALQIAEEMGREECQRAFQGERWNCSSFSIFKAPNISSIATKEAAYVHALSLAAIAHSVAKVCAMGDITSCSCDADPLDLPPGDSEKEYAMGCSDNVGFGINFATQFLHRRHTEWRHGDTGEWRRGNSGDWEGPTEEETEVLLHNLRVAAEVVREKTAAREKPCKCLGVSGACTLLSCPRQQFTEFSVVAAEILGIYRHHNCLHASNETTAAEYSDREWENDTLETSVSDATEVAVSASRHWSCGGGGRHFLFLVDSPNYCVRDPSVGSLGTVGRECSPHHSAGHDSCEHLCTQCGRGQETVERSVEETCYCSFMYCCDIQCHKCPRTSYISMCV